MHLQPKFYRIWRHRSGFDIWLLAWGRLQPSISTALLPPFCCASTRLLATSSPNSAQTTRSCSNLWAVARFFFGVPVKLLSVGASVTLCGVKTAGKRLKGSTARVQPKPLFCRLLLFSLLLLLWLLRLWLILALACKWHSKGMQAGSKTKKLYPLAIECNSQSSKKGIMWLRLLEWNGDE